MLYFINSSHGFDVLLATIAEKRTLDTSTHYLPVWKSSPVFNRYSSDRDLPVKEFVSI